MRDFEDGSPPDPALVVPIGFLDELSHSASKNDVYHTYARWVHSIIAADRATVAISDHTGEALSVLAIEGNQAIETGKQIPVKSSFIGHVFTTRKAGYLTSIKDRPEYFECPLLAAGGLETIADAPILVGDRCFGVLAIGYERGDAFRPEHLTKLETLARCLASYLLLHEQLSQLSELAYFDPLTGVHNRRYFEQEAAVCWDKWQSKGTAFSILIADVDRFKAINDRHGHDFGDEVLREIARVLRENTRPPDIVTRVGGEEFSLIIRSDPAGASLVAERVRQSVAALTFETGDGSVRPTISIGLCQTAPRRDSLRALVIDADRALYTAKREGRNRISEAA